MKKLCMAVLLLGLVLSSYSEDVPFRRYFKEITGLPNPNKSTAFVKIPWMDGQEGSKELSFVEVMEYYASSVSKHDPLERDFKIRIIGLPYIRKSITTVKTYNYRHTTLPFVALIKYVFYHYFEMPFITMPPLEYSVYYKKNEVIVKIINGLSNKSIMAYKRKANANTLYDYKDFLSPEDSLYYESEDKSVIIYGRR